MQPGLAVGDRGGGEGQTALSGAAATGYTRRRPELTTLHRVVRENLLTLYAAVEDGGAGASLPAFVRKELDGYVACGLLSRGFARVLCSTPGCGESRLVAFSCGGRAFCPPCLGRRMCQTTANLLDHVLPEAPLRQWVLTLPHELRRRVAYDGKVFSEVSRLFTDSVLGWYRRRLADEGAPNGRGGAVVVMQRASSDLRCNPHLHGIFLDGVFLMGSEGVPVFRALPRLSTMDAAEVLQIVRARVVRRLVRLGVLAADDDATVVDDVEAEPVLSQLAAAAVAGLPPAGPEVRRGRLPIMLRGKPGVTVTAPRCVEEQGFTLHANTCAGAEDERGREALLQYTLRPPIANEHVQEGPEGLVRIVLKRPFSDGTTAIDLDPLSLLCRLASMVPPPRIHTVRYSGVLGSASKWRSLIIPPAVPIGTPCVRPSLEPRSRGGSRSRYWRWAELLRRTLGLDPEICDRCGGPMKIVALVTEPESISRYLHHLGEPTDPPPLAPARGPPYYQSRVLRRRPSPQQVDMFDA